MTTNRQFVTAKFPNSSREYTFHYDGDEPLVPGDIYDAETARGISSVEIISVGVAQPTQFSTRPILGKSERS